MKKQKHETDLAECREYIHQLLDEYNCSLEYDHEVGAVVIGDNDTNRFEFMRDPSLDISHP